MNQERQIKHQRVIDYLDAHALDAVLLARRGTFSWYTGGAHNHVNTATDVGNSYLLVDRTDARVLTTNIEAARLRTEELAGRDIEVIEYPWHDAQERRKAFASAIGPRRTAADAALPFLDLPVLGADFDRLRWTLTDSEIVRYRALCTETVHCVESAAREAEPGVTENELAGRLADRLRAVGALPWVLLVAADGRIERYRHPLPTDAEAHRYFMLVTCAERDGLICAATRLASFVDVPEDLARRHCAVATVDAALILGTVPGATLGELFALAQRAYAETGHAEEWRNHHQGGSCGYNPREVVATPNDATQVLANQAFAWNPSITGTKSEDTVLCTPDGTAPLAAPTDWPTVTVEWEGQSMERPAILRL